MDTKFSARGQPATAGGGLPAVRDKIATMVPLLGSPVDGEVTATARAIGRILERAGRDWFDFAEAFEQGATPGNPNLVAATGRPPLWADATSTERDEIIEALVAAGGLTAWETDFAASIADQYGDRELSEKQAAAVDRIAKRVLGTWEDRA